MADFFDLAWGAIGVLSGAELTIFLWDLYQKKQLQHHHA